MKRYFLIIVLIFVSTLLGGCGVKTQTTAAQTANLVFSDHEFHVSLLYPSNWIPNKFYSQPPRHEGNNGFFQISALDGEEWTIDQVAENEANHKLKPYGTAPSISKLEIQGQEARLIMPSNDQPKDEKEAAELIIKSPSLIQIAGNKYFYLLMYADKNHIKEIANTIKFEKAPEN